MRKLVPSPKVRALALLAFAPLILTACSLSDLPVIGKYFAPKQVSREASLTVWGLWEPKEIIDIAIQEYKNANPKVSIEYEDRSLAGLSLKSYKEAVVTRLNEGSAPDIVLVHNSWVPSISQNLSPAPQSTFTTSDYSSTFYPVAAESAVSGDNVYAVPISYDGLALVYNRDMFNEAGISSPPSSWEEFRVATLSLTKKSEDGSFTQGGAAIGTANNVEHFSDILGLLFSQAGLDFPADLNTQAAADVLTFYTNFALTEGVWSNVLPPSVEAFADRKVAMIFAPSWQVLAILSRNPQLNIGVAPVPRALDLSGNPISVDWGSFWMFAVSKNSQNSEAAWDFLKFLSMPEQQRLLFSEESKIRAFGEPYSLKELQGDLSGNAYLDTYVRSADTARGGILAGRAGNDKEVDIMKEAVNSVLLGTKSAEALTKAQELLR